MVTASKVVLLKCDPAMHQYVLHLDANNYKKFVIENLDETHMLIDENYVDFIKTKIEAKMNENQQYKKQQSD
mgnify:CR=1 FL=1